MRRHEINRWDNYVSSQFQLKLLDSSDTPPMSFTCSSMVISIFVPIDSTQSTSVLRLKIKINIKIETHQPIIAFVEDTLFSSTLERFAAVRRVDYYECVGNSPFSINKWIIDEMSSRVAQRTQNICIAFAFWFFPSIGNWKEQTLVDHKTVLLFLM